MKIITLYFLTLLLFVTPSLWASTEMNLTKIVFDTTHSQNNEAAYIPAQCYTKTEGKNGKIHNPCFACHINSEAPNYINDTDLQTTYDMRHYSKINRFSNLFKDRRDAIAKIGDVQILSYIRQNNYKKGHRLLLAERLTSLPSAWDLNNNGRWDGYMPDCYFDFDSQGFDKNPQGDYSGWRAFGYYPFLGTFWPTNGSTDDVLIRLPKAFRQDKNGDFNLTVYKINLAIVESLIKRKDITIEMTDERPLGVDLDQNGILSLSKRIVYRWKKPHYDLKTGKITNFSISYVGKAKTMLENNLYFIAPGLYPEGTEFLHSVRYIDINPIQISTRMKELRYAKKTNWNTYAQLQNAVLDEIKEKDVFPDRLRKTIGNSEQGLQNGQGWVYQGFIEEKNGDLRPQNYEESRFCIGCHSGIGATTDSSFAFARKFDSHHFQKGWYHWGQHKSGLVGIKEPKTRDGRYEYKLYLEQNGAGDAFRANQEVLQRFFDAKGTLKQEEAKKIHHNISHLLYPSTERALQLNKAYKVIVDEQSYIYGRDPHMKVLKNVHREVKEGKPTKIKSLVEYQ